MVEGHPAPVVTAHQMVTTASTLHNDIDLSRTGVASVLQELAYEDPRVAAVAMRLESGPPTKLTRGGHASV
jgi:hypothetical protein